MTDSSGAKTCLACDESLPVDGSLLICSDCGFSYHLGTCSGVPESTFKTKRDSFKKGWNCATCRTSKARGGHSKKQESEIGSQLAEINRKLMELLPLKEKVDALLAVKETVSKIESSVQLMSDKYDEVIAQLKTNAKDITNLKKRMDGLEASGGAQEIKNIRNELNELDQYSRRQNLDILGLPRTDGEDLLCKVNDLATKLHLPQLGTNDVEAIHRLPAKPDQCPTVIVRFVSRATRDMWLTKKTYLRESRSEVRLHENMTPRNKRLLWMARNKAAELQYRFVWFKNGKLFVRKFAGDRAIRIASEDDLAKIQ